MGSTSSTLMPDFSNCLNSGTCFVCRTALPGKSASVNSNGSLGGTVYARRAIAVDTFLWCSWADVSTPCTMLFQTPSWYTKCPYLVSFAPLELPRCPQMSGAGLVILDGAGMSLRRGSYSQGNLKHVASLLRWACCRCSTSARHVLLCSCEPGDERKELDGACTW